MRHKLAAVSVTAAALIATAGCSNAPATSATSGATTGAVAPAATASPAATVTRTAAAPPSCKQQYTAWKHGPALALGKKLTGALDSVQTAASSEDLPDMTAGLKTAGTAATALRRYPMPACADPHGYWNAVLARIKAAGDNAGTSSGLSGILVAEAPLQSVPALENKLDAELKKTT